MPVIIDLPESPTPVEQTGPANAWAADLDGYEPTDADQARWRSDALDDSALQIMQRSVDLDRCEGQPCFRSPFEGQY